MSVTNIISGHSMGEKSKNINMETALKDMGRKYILNNKTHKNECHMF